jgi:hypothetical protein
LRSRRRRQSFERQLAQIKKVGGQLPPTRSAPSARGAAHYIDPFYLWSPQTSNWVEGEEAAKLFDAVAAERGWVARSRFVLLDKIGEGNFGNVFKGVSCSRGSFLRYMNSVSTASPVLDLLLKRRVQSVCTPLEL